jgi:hypothetical protein
MPYTAQVEPVPSSGETWLNDLPSENNAAMSEVKPLS